MRAIRHASHNRTRWGVLAAGLLAGSVAVAQQPAWKTGAAFTRQLRENVEYVAWQDRALRDGLDRLSQTYGVAIFLDRRIDPDQKLDFTARELPLEAVWQQLAAAAHAETAVIGSVVYIGPHETAAQLATITAARRQQIARLPNDAKARLLKMEAWQWDELAQPRKLLHDLARQGGVSVENADAIQHDLWPAISLPPLAWIERMTLLLAGFGLTFEFNDRGTVIRLVPLPPSGAPDRGGRVSQTASAAKSPKKGGETLYSLTVANEPAGNVVSTVAKSLGKELSYDANLAEKLKQRVTFELKDATLDYLLQTTLKPLGLTYRVTDKKLEIAAGL